MPITNVSASHAAGTFVTKAKLAGCLFHGLPLN